MQERRKANVPYYKIGAELERSDLSCRLHLHQLDHRPTKQRLTRRQEQRVRERQQQSDESNATPPPAPHQQLLPPYTFGNAADAEMHVVGYVGPNSYRAIVPRPVAQELISPLAAQGGLQQADFAGQQIDLRPIHIHGAPDVLLERRRLLEAIQSSAIDFWPRIARQTGMTIEECMALYSPRMSSPLPRFAQIVGNQQQSRELPALAQMSSPSAHSVNEAARYVGP